MTVQQGIEPILDPEPNEEWITTLFDHLRYADQIVRTAEAVGDPRELLFRAARSALIVYCIEVFGLPSPAPVYEFLAALELSVDPDCLPDWSASAQDVY